MSYVIVEYDKIKEEFPEFKSVMTQLETDLIAKAKKDWTGSAYGGMYPRADQFGKSTIMPQLFRDMNNATLATWDQWLTGTGHQTIMSGANGGSIYEDYKVGICGLAFLDKAIRIAEIRMQISDKKLPRINIEEAMAYEKPAVIFEEAFLLDEKTGFDLYAYVLTRGPQRIKPIGLQVNRVPNKLQTTNTGAALT